MKLKLFVAAAYTENHAAAPPLALKGAKCDIAAEYTKKKNVIRLTLSDQSEYLFMTHDPVEMNQWQTKIQFHAGKIYFVTQSWLLVLSPPFFEACFQSYLSTYTPIPVGPSETVAFWGPFHIPA